MVRALDVAGVVPPEPLRALRERCHGLDPQRVGQRLQASIHCFNCIRPYVPELQGITAKAWSPGDLGQLGASLTGPGRQVD